MRRRQPPVGARRSATRLLRIVADRRAAAGVVDLAAFSEAYVRLVRRLAREDAAAAARAARSTPLRKAG